MSQSGEDAIERSQDKRTVDAQQITSEAFEAEVDINWRGKSVGLEEYLSHSLQPGSQPISWLRSNTQV